MTIAEGVSAGIRYKAYPNGVITDNALAISAIDLGATGGQTLRRVASTLNLTKDTYKSAEIRSDLQIFDFRHGKVSTAGNISGELSPGTYFDFIEAACRGTKASSISASQTDFTQADFSHSASTITFTGGSPSTKGLRTGDVIRFSGLTATANNSVNFLIVSMSGTSNRILHVTPAPTDASAEMTFAITSNGAIGKSVSVPSTGFVSRKFGIEIYHSDLGISRLYLENRIGGFNLKLPATGLGTIEIPVMGRSMETYTAGAAPFFTAPTPETSTRIVAAVNGMLTVGGAIVGVVTGIDINFNLNPSAPAVVGQNFVPEIFLGRADVSGQITALFKDVTLINDFVNETELSVLMLLTTSSAANSPAITIYLPRIKFGKADIATSGEAEQALTLPYQALKADGATAGDEATTIRITDTEAI
jgi:hypothetical protein